MWKHKNDIYVVYITVSSKPTVSRYKVINILFSNPSPNTDDYDCVCIHFA